MYHAGTVLRTENEFTTVSTEITTEYSVQYSRFSAPRNLVLLCKIT